MWLCLTWYVSVFFQSLVCTVKLRGSRMSQSHSFVGDSITDAVKQTQLADLAFQYAKKVLKRDGTFVTKMRDGCEEANSLVKSIELCFKKVERVKPEASRNESAEYFIVAQQFRRSRLTAENE
eukprot:gb/GECG01009194.1/.p1 GENE.gb/GECG01009194.1/~~gb/GECG01009194.1/.p1  ORF type:complete len:123 (+),score=11.71 gb/GECG01009194.1/:1-369(+)